MLRSNVKAALLAGMPAPHDELLTRADDQALAVLRTCNWNTGMR